MKPAICYFCGQDAVRSFFIAPGPGVKYVDLCAAHRDEFKGFDYNTVNEPFLDPRRQETKEFLYRFKRLGVPAIQASRITGVSLHSVRKIWEEENL